MNLAEAQAVVNVYTKSVLQTLKENPYRKICDIIEENTPPKDLILKNRILKECENRLTKTFRRDKE